MDNNCDKIIYMKKAALIILLSLAFTFFCSAFTVDDLHSFPYKKTSYYGGKFSTDLIEKVRTFEGNAASFLKEFDNYDGYKNHVLNDEEKDFFLYYFEYLPEKLQQAVTDNVFAIYFVDGMWYGALTDVIFDANKKPYCIIYFNIETFYYTLDDWLTYRDNTLFKNTDENNKLVVECSDTWSAFLQIFIHEAAHVYDFVNNVTPYLYGSIEAPVNDNPYYSVWKNKNEPLKKYLNKKFQKTAFYEYGKKIDIKDGKEIIDYLNTTPFSTLYAATNWMDDFAEAVTFYYLQRNFGLDYKVTYIKKGKTAATYSYKSNPNIKIWYSLCKSITRL